MKPVQGLTTACLLLLLLPSAAAASAPSITLSTSQGPPTTRFSVSGTGFGAITKINILFDAAILASVLTDVDGAFVNLPIAAPATATPGTHRVTGFEPNSHQSADQNFLISTAWRQAHFTPDLRSWNPYENVLNTANVAGLQLKWKFDSFLIYPAPLIDDNVVYTAINDEGLYVLDAKTGKTRWSYYENVTSSPAIDDAAVYFASWDGNVRALDKRTGDQLWQYYTEWPGGVTLADATVYVDAAALYAIDAASGTLLWSAPSEFSTPAVSNGTLYVGGLDAVNAMDARSGTALWSFGTTADMYFVAVANGLVYASGNEAKLYALDAVTGKLRWSYTPSSTPSSVAVAGGVVYFGSAQTLYALGAGTGELLWKYNYPLRVSISAITIANGVIYVGTGCSPVGGSIAAMDAQNGNPLWRYATNGGVCGAPAVVNGQLFFAGNNGTVYSFGLPDQR